MSNDQWTYNAEKTMIMRRRGEYLDCVSVDSDEYRQLVASGYKFEEPSPEPALPPQPPTLAERLEAAEALIDMMLEAGGETSNG